jgi:hypothetical protein
VGHVLSKAVRNKDARIDAYIQAAAPFAKPILTKLRTLVHTGCPDVVETIKWGMPAFEHQGPLCGMAAFKAHATFGFWKGALLAGKGSPIGNATEKAMGHFGRIESVDQLPSDRVVIGLIRRAASLNEQGVKVARVVKPKPRLATPASMTAALRRNPKALAAFKDFSPSQRREYVEWITEAKQEETRRRRLETAVEWISKGLPRHWKYQGR